MNGKMTFCEKGLWLFVLGFFVFTYLGRYVAVGHIAWVLLIFLIGILFFYVIRNNFKIRIRIIWYHIWMILFSIFSFLSGIWAIKSSPAFSLGFNLIEFSVIMFLITQCLRQNFTVDSLLKLLMLIGYVLDLYVLFNYGIDEIVSMLIRSKRISNEILNANIIGPVTAYSIIINLYYVLFDKKKLWIIFLIPAVVFLVISECRTALISLLFGVILLFFFKCMNGRNRVNRVFKLVTAFLALLLLFIVIYNSPAFSSIRIRMQGLISGILATGKADRSVSIRLAMIQFGIDIFLKHPFIGIGTDNAQVAYGMVYSEEMYLHNNYVELLANVGIVGFLLYYSMFIYLVYQYFKYRNFRNGEYVVSLSLLMVMLLMDIGTVNYPERCTYLLVFLFYWNIKKQKKLNIRNKVLHRKKD